MIPSMMENKSFCNNRCRVPFDWVFNQESPEIVSMTSASLPGCPIALMWCKKVRSCICRYTLRCSSKVVVSKMETTTPHGNHGAFLARWRRFNQIFFEKRLTMMPWKITFSAQVSSFTRKNLLKTRNFKPVCGKEWMMKIDVTVVSVKKPRIPLIKTCSSRECSPFAG